MQPLDVGAGQAQVRCAELLFDAQQVHRGRVGVGAPGLGLDLAAEALVLQVVEPRRALHVRQRLGRRVLEPLEHFAAGNRPLELSDELFQMVLHDTVQVDQIAVDVVDDLHLGRGAQEVQGGAAGKHLDVALVRWEARDEPVGESAFAADPGNDWEGQGEAPGGCLHLARLPGGGRALAGLTGRICGLAATWGVTSTLGGRPVFSGRLRPRDGLQVNNARCGLDAAAKYSGLGVGLLGALINQAQQLGQGGTG